MKILTTCRGFEFVRFTDHNKQLCTIQASSAIGDYNDAYDKPGNSFLWMGVGDTRMHVGREQVAEIVTHLQAWLATGSLEITNPIDPLLDAMDVAETLVRQHCHVGIGVYDSMAISANTEAMLLLADHGRFVIDTQRGRRVVGRFVENQESEVPHA
jgi:hypothetical protein